MKSPLFVCVIVLFFGNTFLNAQDEKPEGYTFTMTKELKSTSVKNQYRSGTCWSFSTVSFLESELIRMGKGEYDLSEMFAVRNMYSEKAEKYVRFQGKINFGGGGLPHDLLLTLKKYGIVPEEVYNGKVIGEDDHIHGELDAVTGSYVKTITENSNGNLSPVWKKGFEGILDAYLGDYPETFTYNNTKYTPESFARDLGINPDDYVIIGSYTHHPFYERFILEVPDNWQLGQIYNIPLEEMMNVIDNSVENGYTVAWGSDVSDKGFSWKNGVAIVPEIKLTDLSGSEKEKWEALTAKEKEKQAYSFEKPVKEKTITQELRQFEFDNYKTTDDHAMHITGKAKDQTGTEFYYVKNSWGSTDHIYKGYFYASKAYVALKTTCIMVHKEAVPKDIRKKLGF